MTPTHTIIDADGHIVEPAVLWQEYIELAFRDRIPQVVKDNEGVDRMKVEGQILPPLTLKPSEYFHRQCFLSCEPDDVALKTAVALDTDKVLMWASDYPHFDCIFPGVVEELKEYCEPLPESAQRNIMSDNAARCYGLN